MFYLGASCGDKGWGFITGGEMETGHGQSTASPVVLLPQAVPP